MSSDNKFAWYWGLGREPEIYAEDYATREAAIAAARTQGGDREGFTIVEADIRDFRLDVFDADNLIEHFEDRNGDCWHDDPLPITATPEQRADLARCFAETFAEWLDRHAIVPIATKFDTMRNLEYFPPTVGSPTAADALRHLASADTQQESPPPRLGEGQGEG